jgi:TonB family protein
MNLKLASGILAALCFHATTAADFYSAEDAYERGEYDFARCEWRRLAHLDEPYSQYRLAEMYREGTGGVQDLEQAVELYRESAEQGVVPAQAKIAELLASGKGVTRDPAAAYVWAKIASRRLGGSEEQRLLELAEELLESLDDAQIRTADEKVARFDNAVHSTPFQLARGRELVRTWVAFSDSPGNFPDAPSLKSLLREEPFIVQEQWMRLPNKTLPGRPLQARALPRFPVSFPAGSVTGWNQAGAVLTAVVRRDGSVGEIQVVDVSPPGEKYGEAAVEALRQWRFAPAPPEGPDVTYMRVHVGFFVARNDNDVLHAVFAPQVLARGDFEPGYTSLERRQRIYVAYFENGQPNTVHESLTRKLTARLKKKGFKPAGEDESDYLVYYGFGTKSWQVDRHTRYFSVSVVDRAKLTAGEPAVVWKGEARLDTPYLDPCDSIELLERLLNDVSKIVGSSQEWRWMGME